jgi:hypothetical protein
VGTCLLNISSFTDDRKFDLEITSYKPSGRLLRLPQRIGLPYPTYPTLPPDTEIPQPIIQGTAGFQVKKVAI